MSWLWTWALKLSLGSNHRSTPYYHYTCVNLRKFLIFLCFSFFFICKMKIVSLSYRVICRVIVLFFEKKLEPCLAQSKHLINIYYYINISRHCTAYFISNKVHDQDIRSCLSTTEDPSAYFLLRDDMKSLWVVSLVLIFWFLEHWLIAGNFSWLQRTAFTKSTYPSHVSTSNEWSM